MVLEKVAACSSALADNKKKISFVESASAGRMSYEFSLAEHSGEVLIGGMVTYDARMKESMLGVPHELIEKYTAESAEVTESMANQFYKSGQSDICVALTGLTAPGGSESPKKPVGTIFIHIVFPDKQLARRFTFDGSPEEIVRQAIEETASVITSEIKNQQ
ncbi:MAG: CinA family protein [Flavobacterium sp.]|nr:MAG: CinA family protein [Flavobacterium sp.]